MRTFIAIVLTCLIVLGTAPLSSAQTRTRRSTPQRRRAPAAATSLDQTKLNAVRLQLAGLNKDLTRFLYLYGRLSKDLELTGAQAESADVASRTKAGLLENVGVMRDRLDQLEGQFRFTKGLERQYQTLQGVSRRADEAAQHVSANRFDQAGRVLLEVSNRLTDVLIEM
ncbi:MAG TPA: hypothetical protein VFS10_02415 [Pyrinomonadaceae bacterium]|nr:hypothetical protein [Pyrinomonadaceae bacterium]